MVKLENRRALHDSIALAVAVYPIITVWLTIIGAPIAIYLVIRHWNSPISVVRHSRWRFVLALIIALLEIGGWAAVLITVFVASGHH
jgi:hypothetical protein